MRDGGGRGVYCSWGRPVKGQGGLARFSGDGVEAQSGRRGMGSVRQGGREPEGGKRDFGVALGWARLLLEQQGELNGTLWGGRGGGGPRRGPDGDWGEFWGGSRMSSGAGPAGGAEGQDGDAGGGAG